MSRWTSAHACTMDFCTPAVTDRPRIVLGPQPFTAALIQLLGSSGMRTGALAGGLAVGRGRRSCLRQGCVRASRGGQGRARDAPWARQGRAMGAPGTRHGRTRGGDLRSAGFSAFGAVVLRRTQLKKRTAPGPCFHQLPRFFSERTAVLSQKNRHPGSFRGSFRPVLLFGSFMRCFSYCVGAAIMAI